MKLLTSRELARATKLDLPGGVIVAKALKQIFRYNRLNRVYSTTYDHDPVVFINSIFDHLDIKYDVPEKEIDNIPLSGSFITVSNHPFGGIDALILLKILTARRPDVRVMANFLLQKIDPLKSMILPVDFPTVRSEKDSLTSNIREALHWVREGHGVALFPAGEVSAYQEEANLITDREWQEPALRAVRMAHVPVIPVYFHGTNSRWFHILGRVHPILRTAKLGTELINKRHKIIKVRIGKPVTVKEQDEIVDIARYGRYLRARTYSLGSALEAKHFFLQFRKRRAVKQEEIEPERSRAALRAEINAIRPSCELFQCKNYVVLYAPTRMIPEMIHEIGRMREITFRAVGEGTNRAIDLDEYDFYYHHLIVWDDEAGALVGAYRIGQGKEILGQYGTKGFYIYSLFRIKRSFEKYLDESLELGRSFIVQAYQKKAMSLYLLWKGLLTVLLDHAEYRYLIGPVSISNEFSKFSKSLIVEYVQNNHFDPVMASYIKPRKRFNIQADKNFDIDAIIDKAEKDIHKVEKAVSDADNGYKIPVLLKKYLEINGHIIGFNVDPDFNNCLDGLMMLDVYNIPAEFVNALSKDLSEDSIKKRFSSVR